MTKILSKFGDQQQLIIMRVVLTNQKRGNILNEYNGPYEPGRRSVGYMGES